MNNDIHFYITLGFLIIILIGSLSLLFNSIVMHHKGKRVLNVCEFLNNVSACAIGYLYYCALNNVEKAVEISPGSEAGHERLFELMCQSSKPLELDMWFDADQIKAINLGNETLTKLRDEGKIQKIEDVLPLIKELVEQEKEQNEIIQ